MPTVPRVVTLLDPAQVDMAVSSTLPRPTSEAVVLLLSKVVIAVSPVPPLATGKVPDTSAVKLTVSREIVTASFELSPVRVIPDPAFSERVSVEESAAMLASPEALPPFAERLIVAKELVDPPSPPLPVLSVNDKLPVPSV